MVRLVVGSLLLASVACTVASEPMLPPAASTGPATPSQSTGEDDPSSSGSMPVLDVGPAGPGECVDCSVQIDSMQSGQLEVTGEQVFATAELEGSVVYAMGTFGRGRFIAAADSSLPLQEVTECPLLPWLAGGYEPEPRLLAFGWADEIELGDHVFPASIHLPARYVGAPALLADDYDVVIYFEESAYLDGGEQPSNAELQTVLEFTDAGGGLVVSSEYATPGGGYLTPADIDSVNRILAPLGMRSLPVSLNWGEVDGVIKFPCFPPVG